MLFNKDDVALILSALQYDRVGTWGDGREEKINTLIMKIKRKMKKSLGDLISDSEKGGFLTIEETRAYFKAKGIYYE